MLHFFLLLFQDKINKHCVWLFVAVCLLLHASFAANHANAVWQQQNLQLAEQDAVLICTGGKLQLVSLSAWQQTGVLVALSELEHQTDSKFEQAQCPNMFLDQQSSAVCSNPIILYPAYLATHTQQKLYNQKLQAIVFHAFSARAPPIHLV